MTASTTTVEFLPDNLLVEILPGESILDAALRAGIAHTNACGGDGECTTCRIYVVDGVENCTERTRREERHSERLGFDDAVRLACQTQVTDDVVVRRLILDSTDAGVVDQRPRGRRRRPIGETRRLAILFADLRGFTALTFDLLAFDVVHILNRFLHSAAEIVDDSEGQIVTYTGDGFMALFGMDGDHNSCEMAVTAGLGLLDEGKSLGRYVNEHHNHKLDVNVGIHIGEVIVGTIGTGSSGGLTAIGDAVNVASRVEHANRQLGSRLLVTEAVKTELEDHTYTHHGPVQLRGQPAPINLYEVTGRASD